MPNLVERLAFHPPSWDPQMGSHIQSRVQYVELNDTPGCTSSSSATEGHRVSFIHYSAAKSTVAKGPARPTILFSHGNAEDLPSSDSFFNLLAMRTGCDVVAWDYLGYGFSSGDKSDAKADCTEKNAFKGVQAVYDHMITTMRLDPHTIFIMGRSLGSGSAVELALRLHNAQSKEDKSAKVPPFGGLILASALWSAISVVGYKLAFMGGLMDIMKNKNKIADIRRVPIFILHGDQDEVVPYDHGKSLYEAVYPKYNPNVTMWTVVGRGHNDIEYRSSDEYFKRIGDFAYGRVTTTTTTAVRDGNKNVSSSTNSMGSSSAPYGKAKRGVLEGEKDADMWTGGK